MQPDPISCLSFLFLFCLRRTVDSARRPGVPGVGNGIEVEMGMEMEMETEKRHWRTVWEGAT